MTISNICYVSTSQRMPDDLINDGSSRYRAYHAAEGAVANGKYAVVMHISEFIRTEPDEFDVYVFHRPPNREKFFSQLQRLAQKGKILVADYDDLIFGDESIALQSSIYKNNVASREEVIRIYQLNLQALRQFHLFTTSTEPLRKQILRYQPDAKVEVVPNSVSQTSYEYVLKSNLAHQKKMPLAIGYASGTRSHNKDFAVVQEQIVQVIKQHPGRSLHIIGVLDIDDDVKKSLGNQLHFHQVRPFHNMLELISRFPVLIAPLEQSLFNDCKSNCKYLESTLAGARLLATGIDDFREIDSKLLNLVSENQWVDAIELALHNEVDSRLVVQEREKLLKHYSCASIHETAIQFYESSYLALKL